jgi:hypothetical protein
MSDMFCGYRGDRESALMAHLYDEMTLAERADFDAHLTGCARCRTELASLGGVRRQLAVWTPPTFTRSDPAIFGVTTSSRPPAPSPRRWYNDMPAWAQVAAAMLVLGVSAGIANLDVRYDASGLHVRTGWSKPAPVADATRPSAAPAVVNLAGQNAPWRGELAALEQQLRREIRAASAATMPIAVAANTRGVNDGDVMRRVKTVVDDSERRQQRELALRVAELARDLNLQRQADLRKIDMSLGLIEDRTGVEVMKNRQKLDVLLQRVSVRQ